MVDEQELVWWAQCFNNECIFIEEEDERIITKENRNRMRQRVLLRNGEIDRDTPARLNKPGLRSANPLRADSEQFCE